jgi:hypothetical protein
MSEPASGGEAVPRRLVFISHSSQDTWVARQIAIQIEAAGARTFLDANDLESGDDFSEEIRLALIEADELLVLWTPWAMERAFITLELGGAWLRGIRITQVLYGVTASELAQRPNFPGPLRQRQMIRLDDIDKYIGELVQRIAGESTP